jgi:diguanylate cyclase (GGDEF)-like protein
MRSRLRDSDIIGRLGGDEFGVILPRTTADEARTTAGDVLTAINTTPASTSRAGRSACAHPSA